MRVVGLLLAVSLVLVLAPGAPIQAQGTQDPKALAALYKTLPFQNIYPLPEGPVALGGTVRTIKIGFSQTRFNHPLRIEIINSARADVARHPNVKIIVSDGNVDGVKLS